MSLDQPPLPTGGHSHNRDTAPTFQPRDCEGLKHGGPQRLCQLPQLPQLVVISVCQFVSLDVNCVIGKGFPIKKGVAEHIHFHIALFPLVSKPQRQHQNKCSGMAHSPSNPHVDDFSGKEAFMVKPTPT
jgi:hypothetical protein